MRKVTITYVVKDDDLKLDEGMLAQILRDAVFEFSNRSGGKIPARCFVEAYVEARYAAMAANDSVFRATKVEEVTRRVNLAGALILDNVKVEIPECWRCETTVELHQAHLRPGEYICSDCRKG